MSLAALLATVATGGRHGGSRARDQEHGVLLLDRFEGLSGLSRASPEDVAEELSSVGTSSRVRPGDAARALAAAFEIGRRAACDASRPRAITDSRDVAAWATPRLAALEHEELWLLALDGRSRLRAARCVAKGGLHGASVRASDPLRVALRAGASGFVLVHNHPSGDPTPSAEDVVFTRRVGSAAAAVGVPLLDHVVVAREGFASVPLSSPEPLSSAPLSSAESPESPEPPGLTGLPEPLGRVG